MTSVAPGFAHGAVGALIVGGERKRHDPAAEGDHEQDEHQPEREPRRRARSPPPVLTALRRGHRRGA